MTPGDEAVLAELAELAEAEFSGTATPANIKLRPFTAYALIGAIQLAYRHPAQSPELRRVLRELGGQLEPLFGGAVAESLRQGWWRDAESPPPPSGLTAAAADTGIKVQADTAMLAGRLEAADHPGQHLWIIAGVWKIADPANARREPVNLDMENLLDLDGPGCFKCEEPYSPVVAAQPCRGGIR